MAKKTILVTGVAGYIGTVLARQLLEKDYEVVGLDNLSQGGDPLLSLFGRAGFRFIKGDVRNAADVENALESCHGVVHLAAIVGDPACAKFPEVAQSTNWDGARLLYDACRKRKHIQRFIFASTCSNYGKMEGDSYVTETSALNPVSLYAKLKVQFEKYLLENSKGSDLCTGILRFSTVYGLSPRMRFDLTVNDFTRSSVLKNELTVFGEQFWRPYCHVEDLARACILTLESPKEKVHGEVYGVGSTEENYQKGMIVSAILKQVPKVDVHRVQSNQDPRDYRVDFSKIMKNLGFKITRTVPDGIREIKNLLESGVLANPYATQYGNV